MTRVRDNYGSLDTLKQYDATFRLVERCGYSSAENLWKRNPFIGGSADPFDFGVVTKKKRAQFSKRADKNGTHHRLAKFRTQYYE